MEWHYLQGHTEAAALALKPGQGFMLTDPPQSKGFGLIGMHERAQIIGGKLSISSQLQQGTQVLITVKVDRAVTG